MPAFDILNEKDLLIIFTYAPAGFGHLRVASALFKGLPKEIQPLILSNTDSSTQYIHRIMSRGLVFRHIMEWTQRGAPERAFTKMYKKFLNSQLNNLYIQLYTTINQRVYKPKKVLIVSTHFGMAHQISLIKERIEKQFNLEVFLVVQMTDDSPQYLWYVEGANLILAPSHETKKTLLQYAKLNNLNPVPIEVSPYPVNPDLVQKLSSTQFAKKLKPFQEDNKQTKINILIPISGAAVGTMFFTHLIKNITRQTDKINFIIVAKQTPYTLPFISTLKTFDNTKVYTETSDMEVVNLYDAIYKTHQIHLEITKPSEQVFKALISPSCVGGSILLIAEPVGRQERDNINFLRRNKLIPSYDETKKIWTNNKNKVDLSKCRGIELPKGSKNSSDLILKMLENDTFMKMLQQHDRNFAHNSDELSSYGVQMFWQKVALALTKKPSNKDLHR